MVAALPAPAQVTDEDIDRARSEVNEIMAGAQALGDEVQAAYARQSALAQEIADLESSIELARVEIAETEQKLEQVAVEMYMGSSTAGSMQALLSASEESYGAGVEYLRNVTGADTDVINQLRSFRTELDRQTGRLAEASVEQETITAELEAKAADLQARLVEAQEVYDALVAQQAAEEEARRRAEEEARRRAAEAAAEEAARNATTTTVADGGEDTAEGGEESPATTVPADPPTTEPPAEEPPPPPESSGGACPVAGAVSFSDSWGDARSGGRAHQGVDMIAARNTPIVAVYAGTVSRLTNGNLSGLAIWLRSDGGDMFFYAHLESYAEISSGQSVAEGEVIGYNGSSGNAPESLPHLHFEYHPGGGSAVNPYPLARSLCG